MNYDQFITQKPVVMGENFLKILNNRDRSITGFYVDIADIPSPEIPSGLGELVPYIPKDLSLEKSRDKVEEIYDKSFRLGWIPVTTTRTLKGVELYFDLDKFPLDYLASDGGEKYSRWFLGYKDNLTDLIVPCIYGHDTKLMLKPGVKNTVNLDIEYSCELDLITTEEKLYIKDLESNTKDLGNKELNYYRLGELEYSYRNKPTTTDSIGVGFIERGKLKFNKI